MKIGKNAYEFELDGTVYRTVFEHKHMRREEGPIRVGTVKAQHVTTCVFGTRQQMMQGLGAAIGISTCSVKDQYSRSYGLRTAFERALLVAGIVKFDYVKLKPGARASVVFSTNEDRHIYGKFVGAFFNSMKEDYGAAA